MFWPPRSFTACNSLAAGRAFAPCGRPGGAQADLRRGVSRGFTLIEVLVALAILALMALVSWRGIDGMSRSQAQTKAHTDAVQTLHTALAQWGVDLDNAMALPGSSAIDWDGRVLRITRRSTDPAAAGVSVVGWTRRTQDGSGVWLRWQSPPLTTRADLELAWQQAAQWGQNPGDAQRLREQRIAPLEQWQIYFFRNDAWSNPLSAPGAANGAASGAADPNLIQGVRLVLGLPAGGAVSGTLTRDWVRPTQGAMRS